MVYSKQQDIRDKRNLRPHAEARLAMSMWGHEYAHEQRGGSMDFWDSIGEQRQKLCIEIIDDILHDLHENGRSVKIIKKRA
jgi:hypothetical protein